MRENRPLVVIAVIATIFLLKWAAAFFIPFFIAVLIAYALDPPVDAVTRLVRSRALAAALVVIALVSAGAGATWAWSGELEAFVNRLPALANTISRHVQRVARAPSSPIKQVKKAAADLESAARTPGAGPAAPAAASAGTEAIPVWQLLWSGSKGAGAAATQIIVVLFLVFFMLASGNLFKKKLVVLSGEHLAQRKFTVQMLDEIDGQIRRYLMVIVVANLLVGVGTWAIFRAFGLEYAGPWALVAAVLHTIPYFGAALIALATLVVALVQLGEWPRALLVALSSIGLTTLVGLLFSTWFASRQTRMNATASFIGLLFFGWIWGLWGLLLGIPLLAMVKTVCDHNEDWKPVGNLLGQ